MTSLESRISLQESRINLLKTAIDPIKDIDIALLTKQNVQTRLEVLEANWLKFDKDHDRICEAKVDTTKDLPYMKLNFYAIGPEAYMTNKATMLELLAKITTANPLDGTTLADTSMGSTSNTSRHMLPKIQLVKFAGDYHSWRSFSDMFTSLIGTNQDLSNVMKMHYLKASVTGEAANLISNFQVSGDNFTPAWDKLVNRYENKRVLINNHLDAIFKLKPLQRKSSKELCNLLATVNEALGALKALGSTTHKWDQIIVYTLVNRLDPETHESWEIKAGPSVTPSTYAELENFIYGRARALESIEGLIDCRSEKTCLKCKIRHHTLIHVTWNSTVPTSMTSPSTSRPPTESAAASEATVNHALSQNMSNLPSTVLLATAQVKVTSPDGNITTARALIDQGSEISFISERLVQQLHLQRTHPSVSLIGVGAVQCSTTRGVVSINLAPVFASELCLGATTYVLPKLTSILPSMKPSKSSWAHISGLRLADPLFMKPGSIDLILGAKIYGSIILAETIIGPPLTPIAQSTIFEWILSGPVAQDSPVSIAKIHHCSLDFHLDKQLEQFWIQESITENQGSELSLEEEDCEQQYVSTVSRNETGRYIVRLPLKGSPKKLGNTRSSAIKMIQSLQHKLNSNPEYRHLYSEFLREYEALIHMSKASPTLVEGKPIFYLPHHGVFREVSSTTKLRVVFNGSYRSSTGVSLNDILHTGAKLQTNISDVLLWFRQYRYVFAADIEKMFRQILIHQEDWDLQRIWWFSDNNLQEFHLRTVTYGLACAPFLALRTINQLIIDHGHQFPLAIGPLTKGRYVDDIFGGADSLSECLRIIKEVDSLCNAGCFPLQKWISNVPSVLSNILHERHAKEPTIIIDESSAVRTLGLLWKPSSDQFQFSVTSNTVQQVTKRNVLSRISQVFDPLGFISSSSKQKFSCSSCR
ncbi:uncharacterized protein LOC123301412 [Chrysoperla carnea]|uniref:uncharacterized protein LOC123301412 n=1 Tax=Chrysoperla carnea TaxID=189513 RepID=UPI001D07E8FC|nr:uncharacterized protein LOC123301412 [Chrysoperla carnea]